MTDIALNLAVGSTLKLESVIDDVLNDLYSEIIGYAQDQSIIMTHPKVDNIPVQVDVGDKFFVSLKQDNSDVTFETEVISVLNTPYSHIYTTYPDSVRSGSFRKSNRVPAAPANIRLVMEDVDGDIPISIFDISCSGACLVSDRRIGAVDDQFQIEINVGTGQAHVEVSCMIRYVRELKEDSHYKFHHGVVFIGTDAEAQLFLWKYVQESVSIQQQTNNT